MTIDMTPMTWAVPRAWHCCLAIPYAWCRRCLFGFSFVSFSFFLFVSKSMQIDPACRQYHFDQLVNADGAKTQQYAATGPLNGVGQ